MNEIKLEDSALIGEHLKEFRKKKGVSQSELADFAGLSRQAIFKLESGQGDIKLSSLIKIFSLLGVDILIRERD